MDKSHRGIILNRLRKSRRLTIRQAAELIGRSVGWLSEIENATGKAHLDEEEFDRFVTLYGGDGQRRNFGGWIKQSPHRLDPQKIPLKSAALKYLRKKTNLTLTVAAHKIGISKSQLSQYECCERDPSEEMLSRILACYGYQRESFENYFSKKERAATVPIGTRLKAILKCMDDQKLDVLLEHANQLMKGANHVR